MEDLVEINLEATVGRFGMEWMVRRWTLEWHRSWFDVPTEDFRCEFLSNDAIGRGRP